MPVVGNGNEDGVDCFVVEQLFVPSRCLDRFSDNLSRQFVAAIVEIAGSRALYPGKLNRSCQQSGALHADSYNPEANSVTGASQPRQSDQRIGLQQNGAADKRSASYSCTPLQELTARVIRLSHAPTPFALFTASSHNCGHRPDSSNH